MAASLGLFLLPTCAAKRAGAGMGGLYWAIIVGVILVAGVIGFFIFQYYKNKRAQERVEKEAAKAGKLAAKTYEQAKEQAFMSRFEKDLDLAAKKKGLRLDPFTQSAFELARSGNQKQVYDLIDKGRIEVDAIDSFGRTLLMAAAEIGDARLCDGLLRRGADINFRNKFNGATVLHFCFQFERESLAMSLVARGADDTVRAIDGRTCYQLRDDQYDVEAGDIEMGAVGNAPPPRRDLNGAEAKGGGKKKSRRNSEGKKSRKQSRGGVDKMGDPIPSMHPQMPGQYLH